MMMNYKTTEEIEQALKKIDDTEKRMDRLALDIGEKYANDVSNIRKNINDIHSTLSQFLVKYKEHQKCVENQKINALKLLKGEKI